MTFNNFILILNARRQLAIVTFAIVLAPILLITFIYPSQFTANAQLLIDAKSPDPVGGVVLSALMLPSYMATQVDVLQSQRVAVSAIRLLNLEKNAALQTRWSDETDKRYPFITWLTTFVQKNLEVKPSKDSNVLDILYTSRDATYSAAAANAFAKAFIDITIELRLEPAKQYNSFYDARALLARSNLERAQRKLSEYQRNIGVTVSEGQIDIETARLNELSTQLVALQQAAMESGSKLEQLAKKQNEMPEATGSRLVSDLNTDLARQQVVLDDLLTRLDERHPEVLRQRAMVSRLRDALKVATDRATGVLSVANRVNESKISGVTTALVAQRSKVAQMKTDRDGAFVLIRDVENSQKSYDLIIQKASQTNLESQNTQTNISILMPATPPFEQSSPRIALNVALAFFLGFVSAVVAVLVKELFDHRIRTANDVVAGLGSTFLGTVPSCRQTGRSPTLAHVSNSRFLNRDI